MNGQEQRNLMNKPEVWKGLKRCVEGFRASDEIRRSKKLNTNIFHCHASILKYLDTLMQDVTKSLNCNNNGRKLATNESFMTNFLHDARQYLDVHEPNQSGRKHDTYSQDIGNEAYFNFFSKYTPISNKGTWRQKRSHNATTPTGSTNTTVNCPAEGILSGQHRYAYVNTKALNL
ncbi:hypothetical protein LguiB_007706 [Lonicera macranthoides]